MFPYGLSSSLVLIGLVALSVHATEAEDKERPTSYRLRLAEIKLALDQALLAGVQIEQERGEEIARNVTSRHCISSTDICCLASFYVTLPKLGHEILAPYRIQTRICVGGCFPPVPGMQEQCDTLSVSAVEVLAVRSGEVERFDVPLLAESCVCRHF